MAPSRSLRHWRIILLVVFVLVPLANYLPILLDIDQDRFTNGTDTRIDAAGYAFSIWGVIFTGMLLFAFFQLRSADDSPHLRRAIRFLTVAGLASIAFVPISFGANYLWGAVDLLWHLVALIGAYVALRQHEAEHGGPAYGWTWFAPSMYLGWISAATVISFALALQQLGVTFDPPMEIAVATGLVIVLTLLGIYLGLRRDGIYALTVAWALAGVAVEQQDAATILWAASAGATCLGILGLSGFLSRRDFFYAT